MWYFVTIISISPKRKLRINIDVIDYYVGDNEIYEYRPKRASVKDIDIDIADIFGQKYRCRIDISKWDIDPPLVTTVVMNF